jgi:hypothetical protein
MFLCALRHLARTYYQIFSFKPSSISFGHGLFVQLRAGRHMLDPSSSSSIKKDLGKLRHDFNILQPFSLTHPTTSSVCDHISNVAVMTISGSMDDRRRKSRSILLTAFVVLVILWMFKLSHPQFSFFPAHEGHESTSATPEPVENQVKENGASKAGKWKTRPENPAALSTDVFNGTITNKAAVIIETRFRTNIIPLILHFSSVLGYSWPIISTKPP